MSSFELFFKLGLHHIWSWEATDHQLFLLALTVVFTFSDWKKVLGMITVFTITHTLSLFLMVYGVIRAPENLVEQAIVWTIILTALSNLWVKDKTFLHRLHIAFAFLFGLVHGLGFAGAFLMMSQGYTDKNLPLLYFAGGIETAQFVVVLFILVFLALWRHLGRTTEKDQIRIVSFLVIGYSLSLLKARMLFFRQL